MKLTVNGTEYELSAFDAALAKQVLAWAESRLPNPLDLIKDRIAFFPPAVQEMMIRDAMDKARTPKSLDSAEVQAQIRTLEGIEYVLCLLFKRHHPQLTVEQIWGIHQAAVKEHGEGYLEGLINN